MYGLQICKIGILFFLARAIILSAIRPFPFAVTKAERVVSGDPRLSLEERYKNHDGYVQAVTKAARKLEKQRFLLPADVQQYIKDAQASDVLNP